MIVAKFMSEKLMLSKPCLFLLFCTILPVVASVTVSTKYGDIEGLTRSYPQAPGSHKSIHRFLGIPYASPPIANLRLKNPRPPKAWKPKVLQAKKHGNACMQGPKMETEDGKFLPQAVTYSEDCLILDVYTPSMNQTFPVMLFIHGGAYLSGTSMLHQGDMLATFGVVVVSIQYRLGPFGFATTGDSTAPGNFGMLDQVEALKWTRENIKHFGGDPSKVTIFGFSAGGTSVCLHLMSPLSADLFHQAIAESGVGLLEFAVQSRASAVGYSKELAEKLACDVSNSGSLVECLRARTAEEIQKTIETMMESFIFFNHMPWTPVVDKHFLHDLPRNLRKKGKFKKAKFIVSFSSQEGSVFIGGMKPFGLPSSFPYGVDPESFRTFVTNLARARNKRTETAKLTADAMQFMYRPWPDKNNQERLREQLIDLVGDFMFIAPAHEVADLHSHFAPVYMFEFSHRSKNGSMFPEWMGVAHGENPPFVFGLPFLFESGATDEVAFDVVDKNVSLFLMTAHTNFAKSGSPIPLPGGVVWDSFNSSNRAYLHIDANPKLAWNFHPRRMAFWNELYPNLIEFNCGVTEKQQLDREGGLRTCLGKADSADACNIKVASKQKP